MKPIYRYPPYPYLLYLTDTDIPHIPYTEPIPGSNLVSILYRVSVELYLGYMHFVDPWKQEYQGKAMNEDRKGNIKADLQLWRKINIQNKV